MIFRTRKLVKYEDLNSNGTLFGGQLLKWMDEEAAIFAMCKLGTHSIVTKLMSEIDFKAPGKLNDVIEIGVDVLSYGRTSITLKAIARVKDSHVEILTIDKIVFVCLDENGKPTPHNKN